MKQGMMVTLLAVMSILQMGAQTLASAPQPDYPSVQPTMTTDWNNTQPASLSAYKPTKAVTPHSMYSAVGSAAYSARALYQSSQRTYVSYGGGGATGGQVSGGGVAHVEAAVPAFHSTSVLLPAEKQQEELVSGASNEPLIQRVSWGPGGSGHPDNPFEEPVGDAPWGWMLLMAGGYCLWRRRG